MHSAVIAFTNSCARRCFFPVNPAGYCVYMKSINCLMTQWLWSGDAVTFIFLFRVSEVLQVFLGYQDYEVKR